MKESWARGAALAWLAGASGCSTYVLQGRVVERAPSGMTIVAVGDSRLYGSPLQGVLVTVERGDGRLAGTDVSDRQGRFAIQLEQLGGRWLEHPCQIRATRPGYQSALSSRNLTDEPESRLLVTMAPAAPGSEGGGRQP